MSARQERNGRKFGEQGRAAVDVLQACGVTDYRFTKGKHAEVAFNVGGTDLSYRFACTPRSAGTAAKSVKRELQSLIRETKARGMAADAVPEKTGGRINPEPPERHHQMLAENIAPETKNGNGKSAATPLFSDANVAHSRRAKAWLTERIEASKKLPPNQLHSEVITVTPALAELILLDHNDGNRAIRLKRVQQWTDAINEGRMKLIAQGISFARDGRLNNGQHRLSAIIAAGRPVLLNVSFGEDRDVFDVIDAGAPRGSGDALKIAGYKNTAMLGAAARSFLIIKNGATGRTFGNDVIRATVEANPKLVDATVDGGRIVQALRCASGATIAALFLIETESRHPTKLGEFIDRLVDGAELRKGDPILVLRDGLARKAFGVALSAENRSIAVAAAIVRAWNLWARKRTASLQKLAWHPGQPFPDVE